MASTKAKTKFIPMPKGGLRNWPPSRGPMPTELAHKPAYEVPPYEIEMIPREPNKRPPPVKRVVPPQGKTIKGRRLTFFSSNKFESQRKLSIYLSHHVATCATLKPEQWRLVGGAVLQKSRTVPTHVSHIGSKTVRRGKTRIPTRAVLETDLPTRALTFDLVYPLSVTARVTVRPYARVGWKGRKSEWMDVGYVLWQLARAYKEIYRKHKRYGVWGHAITDLVFESLSISDNIGDVGIGS